MNEPMDRPPAQRWPRSRKFALSARGMEAELSYREVIVAARSGPGRDRTSFDAARDAWAARLGVLAGDGIYLGELKDGARTLEEIYRGLETSGTSKDEVKEALERLMKAQMVESPNPGAT